MEKADILPQSCVAKIVLSEAKVQAGCRLPTACGGMVCGIGQTCFLLLFSKKVTEKYI